MPSQLAAHCIVVQSNTNKASRGFFKQLERERESSGGKNYLDKSRIYGASFKSRDNGDAHIISYSPGNIWLMFSGPARKD
jgi:hypothetical protein